MVELKIISTSDGSHTLLNTILNETYHSRHGAIRESNHVFIEAGFQDWLKHNQAKEIRILEIGFGTGLNALLTLNRTAQSNISVLYESWEKFPLRPELACELNYGKELNAENEFRTIHECPWDEQANPGKNFTLLKRQADILTDTLNGSFNVIYYDAFAPSRQPEMWSIDILRKAISTLSPGGLWVSYCAKGQVKRDLASLGLLVESLPGPPGKLEMTRARNPKK